MAHLNAARDVLAYICRYNYFGEATSVKTRTLSEQPSPTRPIQLQSRSKRGTIHYPEAKRFADTLRMQILK